jgi:hypothetical protein
MFNGTAKKTAVKIRQLNIFNGNIHSVQVEENTSMISEIKFRVHFGRYPPL